MKLKQGKIQPTEKQVHQQVCDWLNMQHPNLIFTSDASGARVSIGLRLEIKRKRCQKYKLPDLIILHPSKTTGLHGLCLEIKRDGEKLTNKDGEYKTDHLKQQALTLLKLKELGYGACFVVGFDEAKRTIESYLKS